MIFACCIISKIVVLPDGFLMVSVNLRWMNGQHLRALPFEKLTKLIGERWKSTGILTESEGPFVDVRFLPCASKCIVLLILIFQISSFPVLLMSELVL